MSITLKLITAPSTEPISLTDAREHCAAGTDNDSTLAIYIAAARECAEHILGRSLLTQTWERVLDAFPADNGGIELLMPPVASIVSVKYLEEVAGVQTTMASTDYVLDNDSEPGWLVPATDIDWPDTYDSVNAVRVRYIAGVATAAEVKAAIRHAILLRVGEAYRFREEADFVKNDSRAFMNLLAAHRINLGI